MAGRQDAFAVLMSAGRSKQQSTTPKKRSSTAPSPDAKRQQSSTQAQSPQPSRLASQPIVKQRNEHNFNQVPVEQQTQQKAQQSQGEEPLQCQQLPVSLEQSVRQDSINSASKAGLVTAAAQAGLEHASETHNSTAAAAQGIFGSAVASKQDAVAAFKRAFSAGSTRQPAKQKFDYLLV